MSPTIWIGLAALCIVIGILYQQEIEEDPIILQKKVVLQDSKTKIFYFVSDLKNIKKWFPDVSKVKEEDLSIPIGIGKRFVENMYLPLFGDSEYVTTMTAYDPPSYFSTSTNSWLQTHIEIELEPYENSKDQTSLIWRIKSRRTSYLFHYTMVPLLKLYYTGKSRQALFNLKYLFRK